MVQFAQQKGSLLRYMEQVSECTMFGGFIALSIGQRCDGGSLSIVSGLLCKDIQIGEGAGRYLETDGLLESQTRAIEQKDRELFYIECEVR